MQSELQAAEGLVLADELRRMRRLLHKLDYMDRQDHVTIKGKVGRVEQQQNNGCTCYQHSGNANAKRSDTCNCLHSAGRLWQVAAQLQQGHELVLTEMLFQEVMTNLKPEELAAAFSCFVCQEPLLPGLKVGS